ncbi:hypothetical protein [Brachybacterium sp. NPDC056505]|uniref:hypothetical protein n=1 Tax=Brachybacterium sp. NPDC056505 TaxID=3345843 RepID=UPI00366FE2C3
MPFTSGVARALIPEVIPYGVHSRQAMIDAIRQHHIAHGGVDRNDLTSCVKTALSTLRDEGVMERVEAKGYWRHVAPDHASGTEESSSPSVSSVDVALHGPDTLSLSLSVYVTIQSPEGSQTIELIPRPA